MRGDGVIGCFEFLYVEGGHENFLRERHHFLQRCNRTSRNARVPDFHRVKFVILLCKLVSVQFHSHSIVRLHFMACVDQIWDSSQKRVVANERNIFRGIAKLLIMGIRTHINTALPDSTQ